jgi:hypothetical protein
MSYPGSSLNVALRDGPNLDAFGRLRVSQNHILLSSAFRFDLLPLLWEQSVSGGASIAHQPNEGAALFTVPAAVSSAVMQTREYFLYRTGQSILVAKTFAMGATPAGVVKQSGYYDAANGVFFRLDSTGPAFVIRSSTSGAPVENVAAQAAWNLDKMDGTGPSGITLDATKAQVMVIDLQYLGVGRVRVGFAVDGGDVYVHQFEHANIVTTTYMGTGSLPLRYEMTSDGTNGSTMRAICSSVCREGGEESLALRSAASTLAVGASGQTVGATLQTMLAVRLRSDYLRGTLAPDAVEIVNLGTNHLYWELAVLPGFTGATLNPWTAGDTTYEQSTTVLTQSGGHIVACGFVPEGAASNRTRVQIEFKDLLNKAHCNVAGTSPDLLVLRARTLSGASSLHALLAFKEYY